MRGMQSATQAAGPEAEGEGVMTRIGWKLLAIVTSGHACYRAFYALTIPNGMGLTDPNGMGWLRLGSVGADVVCAIGLVGYAWHVRFGHQTAWLVIFPVYVMIRMVAWVLLIAVMGLVAWLGFFTMGTTPVDLVAGPLGALALGMLAYELLRVYGLFRYAYLSPSLWRLDSR